MTEYKRDFGSFHASNVQETINLSEVFNILYIYIYIIERERERERE
jgi:hypothetical protein